MKPLKETSQKQSAIQERVYRLCAQVPTGFFTTYQAIAKNIDTSPRLVGQALKVNPFPSEVVPCHRVISTNFFIGGFRGQWGQGKEVADKITKLTAEGLAFDNRGFLLPELRTTKFFQNFYE